MADSDKAPGLYQEVPGLFVMDRVGTTTGNDAGDPGPVSGADTVGPPHPTTGNEPDHETGGRLGESETPVNEQREAAAAHEEQTAEDSAAELPPQPQALSDPPIPKKNVVLQQSVAPENSRPANPLDSGGPWPVDSSGYPVGFLPRSLDEKDRAYGSRVFIGNLATENIGRTEVLDLFAKHGRLIEEPVIRRSFGFVQYDCEEAAQRAIKAEQGKHIAGMRIDLSLADGRERRTPQEKARARDGHRSANAPQPGRKRNRSKSPNRGHAPNPNGQPIQADRPGAKYRDRNPSVTVRIMAMGSSSQDYAHQCENTLRNMLHLGTDVHYIDAGKLGEQLLISMEAKIPYVMVVAAKDHRNGTCTIRTLEDSGYEKADGGRNAGVISFQEALEILMRRENAGPNIAALSRAVHTVGRGGGPLNHTGPPMPGRDNMHFPGGRGMPPQPPFPPHIHHFDQQRGRPGFNGDFNGPAGPNHRPGQLQPSMGQFNMFGNMPPSGQQMPNHNAQMAQQFQGFNQPNPQGIPNGPAASMSGAGSAPDFSKLQSLLSTVSQLQSLQGQQRNPAHNMPPTPAPSQAGLGNLLGNPNLAAALAAGGPMGGGPGPGGPGHANNGPGFPAQQHPLPIGNPDAMNNIGHPMAPHMYQQLGFPPHMQMPNQPHLRQPPGPNSGMGGPPQDSRFGR